MHGAAMAARAHTACGGLAARDRAVQQWQHQQWQLMLTRPSARGGSAAGARVVRQLWLALVRRARSGTGSPRVPVSYAGSGMGSSFVTCERGRVERLPVGDGDGIVKPTKILPVAIPTPNKLFIFYPFTFFFPFIFPTPFCCSSLIFMAKRYPS